MIVMYLAYEEMMDINSSYFTLFLFVGDFFPVA